MRKSILTALLLISTSLYAAVVFYGNGQEGTGAAVFLENILNFSQSGQEIEASSDKIIHRNSSGEEVTLGKDPEVHELLQYPSFEGGHEGACTQPADCTISLITSPTVKTADKQALQIVFSAADEYCVTKTTGANFAKLDSNVSCEINTSSSGVTFEHYSNAVLQASDDVLTDNIPKKYKPLVQSVMGTTSEGYCVSTTGAATVVINNCSINTKDNIQSVGVVSDLADYVPTNTQGFGSIGTSNIKSSRSGAYLLLDVTFTAGTTDGNEAQFELPAGLVIGETGISGGASNVGTWTTNQNVSTNGGIVLATEGDTFVNFSAPTIFGTGNNIGNNPVAGSTVITTGGIVTFNARIPIANWSAGQDALSSAGGGSNVRLDTANGYGSTATKIRRFTNTRTNVGSGITYEDSATNGASFTVKSSGFYFYSFIDCFTSSSWLGVSLNASSLTTGVTALGVSEILGAAQTQGVNACAAVSGASWLWAGDVIRPHTNGGTIGSVNIASFSIVGLLDMFNATLRDAVKSPGSSNGKPVLYSAQISSTGVVSGEVGSWINGSCPYASRTFTCTFESGIFGVAPNCVANVTDDTTGSSVRAIISTTSQVTYKPVQEAVDYAQKPVSIICHGESP